MTKKTSPFICSVSQLESGRFHQLKMTKTSAIITAVSILSIIIIIVLICGLRKVEPLHQTLVGINHQNLVKVTWGWGVNFTVSRNFPLYLGLILCFILCFSIAVLSWQCRNMCTKIESRQPQPTSSGNVMKYSGDGA